MKLRFRNNSLRLRVNRPEVENLAAGGTLEECVNFPGGARLAYILESSSESAPSASFQGGVIRISAPAWQIKDWARGEAIGLYFHASGDGAALRVAIEKDLQCVEGPAEEHDPDAFARTPGKNC
ncbi:MAG TPA: hypothetical protein VHU83_13740 [Bryobacteraceae bacterium]|jgi:hypothetical protein|nr:hypothetical protein [Bryobacteraceae bacterium]